ncbi:MAG: hypothetical protein ABL999_13630 [Pyrinomonadaceae bacterium]
MADFYPTGMDARAAWHENFAAQLPALAAKYNILAAVLAEIAADNAWMQYWVAARHEANALRQQLTTYFNTIAGSDDKAPAPAAISWSLPAGPPAEVPPGIETRVREIARQVKGSIVYAKADGELLGIVPSETTEIPLAPGTPVAPEFTLVTLAAFELQATFRKMGNSGLYFEYRHKGGNWMPAGTLINSPGTFAVAAATPGVAEQIEIRAIYLLGNEQVGIFSAAFPAFIAP